MNKKKLEHKMKSIIKEFSFGLFLIAVMLVCNFIYGPGLPEEGASNFNGEGQLIK